MPCKFLRGKTSDAGMGQKTGQGSREAKAIGQHILGAGAAKVATNELVAIEDLPEDRFRRWRIHVALFHGRACGKPSPCGYVVLELQIICRIVLLHHAVTVGAAEV